MDTKVQHTPGPWSEKWVRPDPARGHTFDPTCAILAYAPEYGKTVRLADVADPLDAEAEANARLIASAPDLLAALEELTDQLRGIGIPDWHGAEGLTLEQADAAIARAKGEA